MSSSRSRLLTELGTEFSDESARRTLEPALMKSTMRLGVNAGPKPFDLGGRMRRWE